MNKNVCVKRLFNRVLKNLNLASNFFKFKTKNQSFFISALNFISNFKKLIVNYPSYLLEKN